MNVLEIIKIFKQYNENAEFLLIINNKPIEFEILYGSSEGCTKENCENVYICADSKDEIKTSIKD